MIRPESRSHQPDTVIFKGLLEWVEAETDRFEIDFPDASQKVPSDQPMVWKQRPQ